jgi:hypothetical protein
MPAQTTELPLADRAERRRHEPARRSKDDMAASSSSGGPAVESPAQTDPSRSASACASSSPGRVNAKTRRPWLCAICATMCAAAPKP